MSLPVRRPADEMAPIIRQDGQYTLAITPRPVLRQIDGQQKMAVLGVPYGSLPRLVLIHIMTEAVRTRSRHIVLGLSFTDWMRRMGFRTVSYGPRGSATLIRQQLDRLLACEWMIRWDNQTQQGDQEFAVKEVKLSNDYAGTTGRRGSFSREILLTESFFEHLREHAVPLDENAIRQLRDSATALDLYTWLAYRLPRITKARPALLSWSQVAVHFGNEGNNLRKFRQTIRDAWDRQVSAVYPDARVAFDTSGVRLYASPAPLQRRPIRLALVNATETSVPEISAPQPVYDFLVAFRAALGESDARAWLSDAAIEPTDGGPVLFVGSRFKADYIRQTFGGELQRAAKTCGFSVAPAVQARARPA
ncbi:MAG: replication protein RepA [Acetobacteraceae bacterium]